MRHHVFGRTLSRPANQRLGLFNNLIKDLILRGKITTTKQKAKSIQGTIDGLVTQAKKNKINGSRVAQGVLRDKKVVSRFVGTIAPLFADRSSGFTRTIPLGKRKSDTAQMVRLEWVVEIPTQPVKVTPRVSVIPPKKVASPEKPKKVRKSPAKKSK